MISLSPSLTFAITMAFSPKARKFAKITLWIAIPILVLSIAMFFIFNTVYDKMLKKDINLGEGSLVSEIWKDIPLPIYEKVYFFNITNEDAFLDGKPLNVVEMGPYTYKARWVKQNPKWNPNGTVSYREVRTYEFVPDMSNGTEDDLVSTLNAPMILASNFARNYIYLARMILSLFFGSKSEELITQKSVRQLVYEGYGDAIIADAPYVKKDIPYKDGKFSWLYGKNASDDGLFTVFTGVDDASKTNLINNWNGQEKLSFWKGDSCNTINGSTSVETGPPIDDNIETYTFFQSIFCRSLTFNYTRDTAHYDIPSKRFRPTYDLLANGTENPENTCFEVKKERASGVLDISPCQFDAPVFISFPHFHLADSSYLNNVDGLHPNGSLHGSYIDVEPITGLSIDLAVRFQINIEVDKVSGIKQFHKSRDGVYPVLWVELGLSLDEKMADFLKSKVRGPKIIAYSVIVSVAGLSLILIIVSVLVLAFSSKKDKDDGYLISKDKNKYEDGNRFSNEQTGHIYAVNPMADVAERNKSKDSKQQFSVGDFANGSLEFHRERTTPKPIKNIYPSLQ